MTIFMVSVLNQCESMCIMILVGQILVFDDFLADSGCFQIFRVGKTLADNA